MVVFVMRSLFNPYSERQLKYVLVSVSTVSTRLTMQTFVIYFYMHLLYYIKPLLSASSVCDACSATLISPASCTIFLVAFY